MRAGQFVSQGSYQAFVPANLPPEPPIRFDPELSQLLSDADRCLGRLDGATSVLPNPDLFVAMYVRQEAVLSSQIEGTQSTLKDVLQFEIDENGQEIPKDVTEVVNYIDAMNYGLQRLRELPLCKRLICEIHDYLVQGVRGATLSPGAFRSVQNYIGQPGCDLDTATFVPPPVPEMQRSLDNLERFLHENHELPALIQCGLIHAQFETIHPFLDGNGRMGRLLITFWLCQREILSQPLLYLSYYLKQHRLEYYDRLMAVRTHGDWEGWLKFFLRGVREVSVAATQTARAILVLQEEHRNLIGSQLTGSNYGLRLLDFLFQQPITNIRLVEQYLGCTYTTARKTVEQFVDLGLLIEVTGYQRNRRYSYEVYLQLFPAEMS